MYTVRHTAKPLKDLTTQHMKMTKNHPLSERASAASLASSRGANTPRQARTRQLAGFKVPVSLKPTLHSEKICNNPRGRTAPTIPIPGGPTTHIPSLSLVFLQQCFPHDRLLSPRCQEQFWLKPQQQRGRQRRWSRFSSRTQTRTPVFRGRKDFD